MSMSLIEPGTEVLVRAAAAGDSRAWSALVARYDARIRAVAGAHRLCGADADDVAGATWLKAVEHIGRVEEPARFGGWLWTVARRECLRLLRASAREVVRPDVADEAAADAAVDAAVDAEEAALERRAAVRGALTALSGRQRTLLRMLHAEPAPSYEAIGTALGMPVGSIGPTRGRALSALRAQVRS